MATAAGSGESAQPPVADAIDDAVVATVDHGGHLRAAAELPGEARAVALLRH